MRLRTELDEGLFLFSLSRLSTDSVVNATEIEHESVQLKQHVQEKPVDGDGEQ